MHAPARLHFGFLDLNRASPRRFGGVGLALEKPAVRLTVERAASLSASGPQAARAMEFASALCALFRVPGGCRIDIEQAIDEHAGLGSGTQLALAVGVALARLHRIDASVREISKAVRRGDRSGIGIGAFESGGFLVDGGKGSSGLLAPVVGRAEFPADWRVVLILEQDASGLHGAEELAAFQALPDFPQSLSAHLCRLVLLSLLPAVVEKDFRSFSAAIGELQRITGDYFAPAQGGRYASRRVADVLEWLQGRGLDGVGQSSWGPTGFAFVESESKAAELVSEARANGALSDALNFMICAARNRGGEVGLAQVAAVTAEAGGR